MEASRRFGISPWQLGRLVMADILPVVSVDGFLMAEEDDVRRCLEALGHTGRPTKAPANPRPSGPRRPRGRAD